MEEQTLQEFARANLEGAKSLVRQGKELTPVLIMDGGEQPVVAAFPEYGDETLKAYLRKAMKAMLWKEGAERYCFVMEAWFGSPPGKAAPGYRPSNDPARKEGIAVCAATKSGEKILLVAEIKRGKGKLVQFEDHQSMISFGPLGDLFDTDTRQ